MTIRIPIIGQSTTTSFVPQQDVQALQVSDPRGQALQGLGKGLEEFGDGLDKYDKAHPAVVAKAEQDNNAWALQAYAQCVKHGSDLTAHLAGISTPGDGTYPAADSVIASSNAGADASPLAYPATLLNTPNPIQAMIAGFMPGGASGMSGGTADTADNTPSPTDASVHGTTGAWVNGYDLGAQAAIAAAPSKSVAASLAAQCDTDRLQGARAIMGLEAQGNVQQRQSTALKAAQTIATYGVAADPATLPQALAFIGRHPIRVDGTPADQADFDARLRQIVVAPAIQTLLARDPQGTLRQLQGGPGGQSEAGENGEPDPPVALHPAIAALTPEERMGYLPQAHAAVYAAQGKAQADLAQRSTAAIAPGANAAPPPALPEFISAYGAERGTQLHAEMTDKLSQNQYRQNFAALPSAEVERARNDAQAGLHATARANADILGTPAPDEGDGNAADPSNGFGLRTQGDVADPHYAAQSREATNLQSAAAAILTARAQDPVKAGIDAGAFGLKPADMSSPQAVLASAATRAPVVGVIADTYNTGRVAFSNSEFADLGKTVAALPAQERGPFFQQLADKLGDPDLVRATFKRLGADSPVLAEAARMQYEEQASQSGPTAGATGIISAPEHMYKGFTALHPTDGSPPQAMPPDAQTRAVFMPREGEDAGPAETRYQATRAIYASLAKDDDDKSGKFDAKRWQVAQNLATKGSGTAGEVGLGPDPVASSRLSESGTPVGNQLHADLERVMRGNNPFQEGDGAPAVAQSGAMDILDPDKPNPTLAKHDENPMQLAFNTYGLDTMPEAATPQNRLPPEQAPDPDLEAAAQRVADRKQKAKQKAEMLERFPAPKRSNKDLIDELYHSPWDKDLTREKFFALKDELYGAVLRAPSEQKQSLLLAGHMLNVAAAQKNLATANEIANSPEFALVAGLSMAYDGGRPGIKSPQKGPVLSRTTSDPPPPSKTDAFGEINGEKFYDANAISREKSLYTKDPTLIKERAIDRYQEDLKKQARKEARGEKITRPAAPVNSNMEDAHAEVGMIQQAHRAGKTQDQDMTLKVTRDVCSYCVGDIARTAEKAGLNSLSVIARNRNEKTQNAEPFFYYRWTRGMTKLEKVQPPPSE